MNRFEVEVAERIEAMGRNKSLQDHAAQFMRSSIAPQYSYNFSWMSRPIIQYPQDIVAVQELIWSVRPDLVIETGIAHGGSLILSASMLALLDITDAIESAVTLDPAVSNRRVVGIDIDIRAHNRAALEQHPMFSRIELIEGSSIAPEIVSKVHGIAAKYERVLVFLDSNHTHDHVLAELEAYSPLVTPGSYCVVFDTIVEDLPADAVPDRPWGPGDNPKTAVWEFLKASSDFAIDESIQNKLQITVAPDGYLRRIR